uniref:Uncharacterized protein n=1 Tax=Rhizophora mucronata TaxID=61149 RepID=A0A2P2M208_RHIMU
MLFHSFLELSCTAFYNLCIKHHTWKLKKAVGKHGNSGFLQLIHLFPFFTSLQFTSCLHLWTRSILSCSITLHAMI